MTSHYGYIHISDSLLRIHSANSFTTKYAVGYANLFTEALSKADVNR